MFHANESCVTVWNEKEHVLMFEQKGDKFNPFARGLTKTLSAQFSPDFSISVAMKEITEKKHKKRGRFYGNQTDRNIVLWVTDGLLPKYRDERFDIIKKTLEVRKWIPIAAQIPVGCSHLRLATKIDFICQNEKKEIILIELKCGFDDYFNVHNQGFFQYPFQEVHISFRNKSFLQLLLTLFLFFHSKNDWNQKSFGGAYICHVFESSPDNFFSELISLPFWTFCCSEIMEQAILCLKQSKNQNKRKRSLLIQNGAKRARYAHNRQSGV
jgi:hypothetical protein